MIGKMVETVKSAMTTLVPGVMPPEIKDGEDYFKPALEEQKIYHPTWYRNIAMFSGHQWMDWSTGTNWLAESAAPSWRVRLTTNLVLPTVRSLIARELQNDPRFYGMPANGNPESKRAARMASRIFEAKYHEEEFLNIMIRLRMWTRLTGSAYLFTLWDPSRDHWVDDAKDPETGAAIIGPDGQSVKKNYAKGDIIFDVANSFEVLLPPGAPENFLENRKLMRMKLMDVDQIEENWDVKVDPEKMTTDMLYQARVMSLVDSSGRVSTSLSDSKMLKHKALVKDFFELPCKKYPVGRHFTYANGKILQPSEPIDYFYAGRRTIPASKSDDIFMVGRAQGSSTVEHIAHLNVQYNKMMSSTIEDCNLTSRPKYIAPVNSLEDDAITDQPGEVVEYTPQPGGQKPEPLTPPSKPEYFFTTKDEVKKNIEEVSGVHDVSLGRLPRRANSGKAIEALQSGDESHVALSIKSCATALSRGMSIALERMQRGYTEERIVHMVGRDHQVDVITFKGADLKGCDVVRVTFGPHMSRQQKIDLALDMAEAGLISKDEALEIMELGDFNIIFESDQAQKQYATFESMGLAKGIGYPVGQAEPHLVHIKEHQRYFDENEATMTPEGRAQLTAHIESHKAFVAAAAQGMPGGQPPVTPPGPAGAPPAPEVLQ
jgi:hypothetical protein